jgi:hypothetical protein
MNRTSSRWAAAMTTIAAAALLTAGTASPARAPHAAKFGARLASCIDRTTSTIDRFSALNRMTYGFSARGDSREPDLGQLAQDLPGSAKGKAGKNFSATVPVWFHVVTDGSIGNVSDKVISDQIRVLNLAYAGFYGGARTGFSFTLVGVDRTNNADWFYTGPGSKAERDMKAALHRGGRETLNIYSTTAGAFLGWAYLPGSIDQQGQALKDGIVIDWESEPGASATYADRYDLGHTATHETGHWLDLEHTFYGGCNHWGDYVEDTPPELTATSGCPVGKDTCPDPGLDPIHNYMDYSYDECYSEFTQGQAQRMRDAWLLYRA